MNKAFVKEADDPHDRCPGCGATGTSVYAATMDAQLPPDVRQKFSEAAFFCPGSSCRVAYFDQFEQTALVDQLASDPGYPKEPTAPICSCFGFTCENINEDIDEGVVTRTRAHLERAKSSEANCQAQAIDGQSCIAAVQKYYMEHRG